MSVMEGGVPGSPLVKTLHSKAGGASSIPGWGAKILHASQPKNQNIKLSNIVTNSIRTLKVVHIKKSLKQEKGEGKGKSHAYDAS